MAFPDDKALNAQLHILDEYLGKRCSDHQAEHYNALCLMHKAISCSINPISFADMESNVIYANQSFLDMWGFSNQDEVLGRKTHDFWKEPAVAIEKKEELFSKGVYVGQLTAKRKNGNEFEVRFSANLVKDDKGKSICTMASFVDVTQSSHAIAALKASEEQFKMLFYGAAEGIIAADAETMDFGFANPAICKMLGYSQKELANMNMKDIHPAESFDIVLEHFQIQISGKKSLASSMPCLCKDGRIIYADVNSALVEVNGRDCNIGFFTDVTEKVIAQGKLEKAYEELEERVKRRTAELLNANNELIKQIDETKRAEKAIQIVEARFKEVFDNALVGIYRTTREGKILMANPALVKMLGYDRFEDLAGRDLNVDGFEPSYSRDVFQRQIEEQGSVIGLESVWVKRDGGRINIRESAILVCDDNGKVLYYEGTIEDITAVKSAEQQLLLYQKRLKSLALEMSLSEERLRRNMAMSLHDHIGQNIAVSKIKADTLVKLDIPEEAKKEIEIMRELLSDSIQIVRNLNFELSPPVLYELGFEAAIEWLVNSVREKHNLNVEFEDDDEKKPLDEKVMVLLFQSVKEALMNVTKHAKSRKSKVFLEKRGDSIYIEISDDGLGFDVSQAKSDNYRVGFGLFSISERIEYIGGSFDIESGSGIGTKVSMIAPLKKTNQ